MILKENSMEIKLNNRWDELSPEVQIALTRLINHIASRQRVQPEDKILEWLSEIRRSIFSGQGGQAHDQSE